MAQLKILALNPNSSESVTASVVAAMRSAVMDCDVDIVGTTCAEGPEGIVTQADFDSACIRMEARAAQGLSGIDAVIIACFSDPGLQAARMRTSIPVLGLGEEGARAATALGQRIGVVAVADAAIPRHLDYWRRLNLSQRIINERALNLPVAQSGDAGIALSRMTAAAKALRDVDGADVILLGCAGMSNLRAALSEAIGLPVVDPCEAAVNAALAMLQRTQAGAAT